MQKKEIAIIGGGAAAMMLACTLDSNKFNISMYEKNAAFGRKFLVAGDGGLNLTHSEETNLFVEKYYPSKFIAPFVSHFSNTDLIIWLQNIGIETFVGTSKRVFPKKEIIPIAVLKAIEKKLIDNNVTIYYHYNWEGWHNHQLQFSNKGNNIFITASIVVFALGGASWPKTGSTGNWINYFKDKGITIKPFLPSNCAYKVNWTEELITSITGKPLKNCEFTCGSIKKKGEAVITDFGIEGNAIYALSKEIREQLSFNKSALLTIDFKPEWSIDELKSRIENFTHLSIKEILEKKINLTNTQIQLIKSQTTKEEYHQAEIISKLIKSFPITFIDLAPIENAISTVGGIDLQEVTANLELKKLPNHYCMGEMLDWDAPTGGYLLQACFSMGNFLADKLNNTFV